MQAGGGSRGSCVSWSQWGVGARTAAGCSTGGETATSSSSLGDRVRVAYPGDDPAHAGAPGMIDRDPREGARSMTRPFARPGITAAAIFGFFLAYAVVRYHLFKGVPWEHLPLYTVNKALAMASTALAALAVVLGV